MQARNNGILTPETAHAARQCLDHPNPEADSHLQTAATWLHPVEAMSVLAEAGNGRSTMKTTKTLPASAAAWAQRRRPIN